ncbi:MAG: O-antigen ligase family protein [Phycisphaerales bacterium JB040]
MSGEPHTELTPRQARAWLAAGLVLIPTFLRAMVVHTPLPWWDADPSLSPPTGTRLAPSGTLLLDVVTLLGVGLAAWTCGTRAVRATALLGIGSIPVFVHASAESEHLVVAGPWLSGLGVLLASAWLGRDPAIRRVLLGLGLGFVAVLLLRSLVQLWVEHAETVRSFRENREAVLASQGWAPGSGQARLFERRLEQPDVRAWFGTSNMLATFAGAGASYAVLRLVCEGDRARRLAWLGSAALCLWLIALTGSKGGLGALLLGLFGAGAWWAMGRNNRLQRLRAWVPIGACVLVLLVVALRGVLGERLGELSLLFRAQYLEASLRIISGHPLVGVGPAGFQEAYLLAKNPLNPEEVSSPHSLAFDWLAMLGIGSAAWLLLLGTRALRNAGDADPVEAEIPPSSRAAATRALVLVPVLAFAGGAYVERDLLVPVDLLARIAGVGLWIAFARFVLSDGGFDRARAPAVGLTIVLLGHAMIEMTPVRPGSAGLWFLLLGASAPGAREREPDSGPQRTLAGSLVLLLAVPVAWVSLGTIRPWERHLRDAGVPLASAGMAVRDGASPADPALVLPPARVAAVASRARASDARPEHVRTRLLISGLAMQIALDGNEPAGDWIEAARGWAAGSDPAVRTSHEWRRLGSIEHALLGWGIEDVDRAGPRAVAALERAFGLDPYNPQLALELARWPDRMGLEESAGEWAARALELNAWRRLDPLRQFPGSIVDELRRLAGPG